MYQFLRISDKPRILAKEVDCVKLAVPFELRVFLVVMLVGIISILVILDTAPEQKTTTVTSKVIQGLQQPGEPSNTLVISGIDIGQTIGFKSPTISGNEFACFADKRVTTNRGRATVRYFLALRDPNAGGFNGCRIEFAQPSATQQTGLYLRCPSTEDMFAFTMSFEPSLNSEVEDNELEDLREKTIPMFNSPYTIVRAEANTGAGTIEVRFMGPAGTLDIADTYTDMDFSQGVEINGKHPLDGRVRVIAQYDGRDLRISSIEYRFRPLPVLGRDVYVPDHQGVKQKLRTPEAFLGDFDILFRGLFGAQPKVSTPVPARARYGGNVVALQAAGGDKYYLIFTNNRGQGYKFPLMVVSGGGVVYGDRDRDFLFSGAGAGPPFNIDVRDYFAVTDRNDRRGITNIIEYSSVDAAGGKAYFQDFAGGSTVGHFDAATGDGTVIFGGNQYVFRVDTAAPFSMTIDQNGDGTLGGTANIVIAGGPRIILAGGGGGTLHVPPELFAEGGPAGGENVVFTIFEDDGDVNADVTSGVQLFTNDATGMKEGLTTFGTFVQLDDRRNTARDLIFNLPAAGGPTGYVVDNEITGDVAGGQAQGEVLITCERSAFVAAARAAKAKK